MSSGRIFNVDEPKGAEYVYFSPKMYFLDTDRTDKQDLKQPLQVLRQKPRTRLFHGRLRRTQRLLDLLLRTRPMLPKFVDLALNHTGTNSPHQTLGKESTGVAAKSAPLDSGAETIESPYSPSGTNVGANTSL